MSRTFTTSDNHWHHFNNCRGTSRWEDKTNCRDFDSIDEYDGTMLEYLNCAVMPEDTLINVGDFSLGCMPDFKKVDAYIHFRNKIRCKNIIYVRGNHSLDEDTLNQINIFSKVKDYYELKYKGKFISFFHFPIRSWNNMNKNSYHCYGHCHHKDYKDSIYGRSMDIGVDGNDLRPWLLDDVIEILKSQPSLKEGHHH